MLRAALDENCRVYHLEAAELLADGSLLPKLEALRDKFQGNDDINSSWYRCLLGATEACAGNGSDMIGS
jgi:hypothetical protein